MTHELRSAQALRDALNKRIEQLERYQHLFALLEARFNNGETLVIHDDMGNTLTLYRSHIHNDYVVEKNQEQIVAVDDLTVVFLVLILQVGNWHP